MAKRRRGMSLEEKRDTMNRILFDAAEPFDLKELERIGGKAGVVTQTIKEVVQSLVDDCRVSMEKIGAKNFFYAFPSTTYRNLMNRTEKLEEDIAGDQARAEAATAESATLEADRGESEERAAAEARLAALEAEQAELEAKLKVHADNDPAVLERLADNVLAAKQGADRWTDNVFSMRQMCVTKFNTDAKQFDRMMGITDSFDYVT